MINSKPMTIITENVVKTVDSLYGNKTYSPSTLSYLYLATTGLMINFGSEYVDDIFNGLKRISLIEDDYYDLEMYFAINNVDINYNIVFKDEGLVTLEKIIKYMLDVLTHSYNLNDSEKIVGEVVKSLAVEEIIKSLYSLKEFELDGKIKAALKIFDDLDITNYHFDGNNAITNLFRPLFKFNFLKDLFNKNLIAGDYREVYQEFDDILGEDAFDDMINKIDGIKKLLKKKNVNTYSVACAYVNVRNNFVQSYITKKFA